MEDDAMRYDAIRWYTTKTSPRYVLGPANAVVEGAVGAVVAVVAGWTHDLQGPITEVGEMEVEVEVEGSSRGVQGDAQVVSRQQRRSLCNSSLAGKKIYTLKTSSCCKNRNETQPRYHMKERRGRWSGTDGSNAMRCDATGLRLGAAQQSQVVGRQGRQGRQGRRTCTCLQS